MPLSEDPSDPDDGNKQNKEKKNKKKKKVEESPKKKGSTKLGVAKRQLSRDRKLDNERGRKRKRDDEYNYIWNKVNTSSGYCVGGTGFTYNVDEFSSASEADLSTLESHDTYEEDDFVMSNKRRREVNTIQQMRDLCGLTHSVCKLASTVSNGLATKGKRYSKPRKCSICDAMSRVKCRECNKVFCYPLRNRSDVPDSCFYKHVKGIKRKSKRKHSIV